MWDFDVNGGRRWDVSNFRKGVRRVNFDGKGERKPGNGFLN
jgi:hypothetical protein